MLQVDLSIVVPLHNEGENVRPLYDAITSTVARLPCTSELVFVDDGSQDETLRVLRLIQCGDPAVRVVKLRRNFGQTAAMRAGIQIARGRLIVTLDGDLQNDPADIPELLAKIEQGYDLVVGWRRDRRDPLWSRTFPSRVANRILGTVTGVSIHDSGCSLKAYRAEMIKRVPLYAEMHRFIPALSSIHGARITEVAVRHAPRRRGRSNYGFSRVGRVLLDVLAIKMLIAFRHRPLQWFCALSVPCWIASLLAGVACVALRWQGAEPSPLYVPQTVWLLCMYTAAHLIFVGFLAELIVRADRLRVGHPRAEVQHVDHSIS